MVGETYIHETAFKEDKILFPSVPFDVIESYEGALPLEIDRTFVFIARDRFILTSLMLLLKTKFESWRSWFLNYAS